MKYYDALLMFIPVSFVLGGGVSYIVTETVITAVLFGSLLSIALVGHGLFVRPPLDATSLEEPPERKANPK